ncbi:Choline/ethanolaminephosphotransferase 1 [Candida viswanathii]|uniref:Choline/ethanolaminephosphotransferase 1 n=1 Tax=Candida viswanathii TaxID=5486 RepID=A0A367YHU0_9ASCO|nr:Choline/ethanolaminephosphotransferase 1 [Candida viswanathii]
MGLFVPTNKLHNLKLYKYSSEDHSIISKYILKKWWSWFVQIFPLWMAPNVVTLLGLFFVIANCYTFDGCDGAHARRTKQSGPLGELFDHSIDAINTTLGSFVFASVLKMGYGGLFLLSQFATVCNFYCSTWEEYHTHTLFLSKFSGPVEGILMICAVYIITGILGPDIWSIDLFELNLTSLGYDYVKVDSSIIYVVIGLASMYFNIAQAMSNVAKYYKQKEHNNEQLANKETAEAYQGLYPFSSTTLSLSFTSGFPYIQYPMIIPIVQLVLSKFLIGFYGFGTAKVLHAISWLGCGVTLGIHIIFVADIIFEITTYLDIYALSIKHKKVH